MADERISEILKDHISNAEKQLEYMRLGISFVGKTDPIPSREIELIELIEKWKGELDRHEGRQVERD